MNAKENALRIIRFDHPECVVRGPPTHGIAYRGCNHEGYTGGGHHLPVGSHWYDIWGVGWFREHEGVMGFPREHPLADLPAALATYRGPTPTTSGSAGKSTNRPRAGIGRRPSSAARTGTRSGRRATCWWGWPT